MVLHQMKNKDKKIYTCPMHSEVESGKGGKCPKCKMDLVKVKAESVNLGGKFKKSTLNNKLRYIVISAFLLSLIWFLWVVWYKVILHKTPDVHYHAGFIVVKDNRQENFADFKFMKFEPCTVDNGNNHQESEEDKQLEKAHLHDNIGDVVHVERNGAKWKDLFTNIKYGLNYSEAEAYINGNKVSGFQNRPIEAYDSLVVFIGTRNDFDQFLSKTVTREHIQEAESKDEGYGGH